MRTGGDGPDPASSPTAAPREGGDDRLERPEPTPSFVVMRYSTRALHNSRHTSIPILELASDYPSIQQNRRVLPVDAENIGAIGDGRMRDTVVDQIGITEQFIEFHTRKRLLTEQKQIRQPAQAPDPMGGRGFPARVFR